MSDILKKIDNIMKRVINEVEDVNGATDKKLVQIFYSDLDMSGKKKVLEAIDASFEYVDVFSDNIVRNNIEEALSKRPLITMSGEEIVNITDIDL